MQRLFKRLFKSERGAIAIMFAVMLNSLIMVTALALDLSRAYLASAAISGAADSAAFASAIVGGDAQRAKDYFIANLPTGTMSITYNYDDDVEHTIDTAKGNVQVTPTGFNVPAFFSAGLNGAGSGNIDVASGATVGLTSLSYKPIDYFLIIDSSGSMATPLASGMSRAQALGQAVNTFLDIVFQNQTSSSNGQLSNFRVSLTNYRNTFASSNPLNDDKAVILSQLNGMLVPRGGTCGGCGLENSLQRLRDDKRVNPSAKSRQRVYIFLTDGELNYASDGYVRSVHPDPLPPPPAPVPYFTGAPYAHPYAKSMCDLIKVEPESDVSFWSIGFGPGSQSFNNKATLDYCASVAEQSIYAQSGDALKDVFSNIGRTTGRIRLQK